MGGVLMNGCGAIDYFQKLKLIKSDMCPGCGKMRDFYLCAIRMKATVLFIPIAPVSRKKYGIVCTKCKYGFYISEEQMSQIMVADEAETERLYNEIMNSRRVSQTAEMPINQIGMDALQKKESTAAPQKEKVCPKCGKKINPENMFCGFCGSSLQESSAIKMEESEDVPGSDESDHILLRKNSEQDASKALAVEDDNQDERERQMESSQSEERTCPECRQIVGKKDTFCGFCGCALSPVSVCPSCGRTTNSNDVYCGYCGASLTEKENDPSVEQTAGNSALSSMLTQKSVSKSERHRPNPAVRYVSEKAEKNADGGVVASEKRICPVCGGKIDLNASGGEGYVTCKICGTCVPVSCINKLLKAQPEEKEQRHIRPEQKTGWICGLCGTENPRSEMLCKLCGEKHTELEEGMT